MNSAIRGFVGNPAFIEARLGVLALRLQFEVTRLRALRSNGRGEQFAGVLLRDEDIGALCDELVGQHSDMPDLHELQAQTAAAAAQFQQRLHQTTPKPKLHQIAELFGLDAAEETLFFLAMAPAIDPRFGRIYGFLHEDMAQQYLTLGLAQRLIGDIAGGGIEALRPLLKDQATLLRYGMIELTQDKPLVSQKISVSDTVIALLVQDAVILPQCVTQFAFEAEITLPSRPILQIADTLCDPVIAVHGALQGPIWAVERDKIDGQHLATAQHLVLHSALRGVGLVFLGWDSAPVTEQRALAASLGCHCSIATQTPAVWQDGPKLWMLSEPIAQTAEQCRAFWAPLVPSEFVQMLAAKPSGYSPAMMRLAQHTMAIDGADVSHLAALLRSHLSAPMQGLADLVATPFGLEMLILPGRTKQQLTSFADRYQSRVTVMQDWGLGQIYSDGIGAKALFVGPSGVGKTMSAGAIANHLGIDLWRINLASVVSKYIGQTESNLERIFQAAQKAEVLLFFDECESLFAKRGDVKDARDRYANMEMSYLLQRLETFQGMAVLASNMGQTLDPALLRRFDLVLEFSMPDVTARRGIWDKITQAQVPLADDVDLDAIAKTFELSGGHIRQAILGSAHCAAQAAKPICHNDLLCAIAREYTKLGKPLRRDDFGAAFAYVRGL